MNFQDFMYTTSKTEDLYTHLVVPQTKRDMVKFITEKGEMYDIHLNPLTLYKGIQIVPKHVFPMTLPKNNIVYQNGTNIKHSDLFVETPEHAVIVTPHKRSSSQLREQKINILVVCHCADNTPENELYFVFQSGNAAKPLHEIDGYMYNVWFLGFQCEPNTRQFKDWNDFKQRKGTMVFDKIISYNCPLTTQQNSTQNILGYLMHSIVFRSLPNNGQLIFQIPDRLQRTARDFFTRLLQKYNNSRKYTLSLHTMNEMDFVVTTRPHARTLNENTLYVVLTKTGTE